MHGYGILAKNHPTRITPREYSMPKSDWDKMATNVLKGELVRAGVDYAELVRRFKDHGLNETYHGVAAKINRGTFSFTFFLQCLMVLGKTKIRL